RLTVQSGGELSIGGTTGLAVGSLAGNGTIIHTTTGGTFRAGGDNSTSTWSGSIQGGRNFAKAGAGELHFTTSQPYTGATTIEAGVMYAADGLPASAVTIQSGASLFGHGTFAALD